LDLHQIAKNRHHLRQFCRDFFTQDGYLEVDTPILTVCPGTEVHLHYFGTEWQDHDGVRHRRFLRSSPELHMKRLIAAGLPKIFQLASCFRNNGEYSEWHNPEFCMLEWYQVGQSFNSLIEETESFLRSTAEAMADVTKVSPADILPERFIRVRVEDAFLEFAGLKLLDQDADLAVKAREKGVISVLPTDDFETAFFKVLIERIEPAIARLGGCVLYDYPPSQAALAKVEGGWAMRFEFYIGRVELCNGFFELTGEHENRARLHDARIAREKAGNEPVPVDESFLMSMRGFTEPCAGNALGFDRWLAILTKASGLEKSMPFRMIESPTSLRY